MNDRYRQEIVFVFRQFSISLPTRRAAALLLRVTQPRSSQRVVLAIARLGFISHYFSECVVRVALQQFAYRAFACSATRCMPLIVFVDRFALHRLATSCERVRASRGIDNSSLHVPRVAWVLSRLLHSGSCSKGTGQVGAFGGTSSFCLLAHRHFRFRAITRLFW